MIGLEIDSFSLGVQLSTKHDMGGLLYSADDYLMNQAARSSATGLVHKIADHKNRRILFSFHLDRGETIKPMFRVMKTLLHDIATFSVVVECVELIGNINIHGCDVANDDMLQKCCGTACTEIHSLPRGAGTHTHGHYCTIGNSNIRLFGSNTLSITKWSRLMGYNLDIQTIVANAARLSSSLNNTHLFGYKNLSKYKLK